MYECLLLLAYPVDPADGLELLGGVEEGLGQDDVARLHQVQTVGALADRHQQHSHVLAVLETRNSLGIDNGSMDARNVKLNSHSHSSDKCFPTKGIQVSIDK